VLQEVPVDLQPGEEQTPLVQDPKQQGRLLGPQDAPALKQVEEEQTLFVQDPVQQGNLLEPQL
jgi:hypothetical protein